MYIYIYIKTIKELFESNIHIYIVFLSNYKLYLNVHKKRDKNNLQLIKKA